MIDALILARIQFGLSLGVHFIFPALTLGLTLYVLMFETAFAVTGNAIHRNITEFLVKLLSLVFTFGVATGVLLPFSFGANWATFSLFSGQLFGTQLAIEAFTAFAVESIGIAILVFEGARAKGRLSHRSGSGVCGIPPVGFLDYFRQLVAPDARRVCDPERNRRTD